MFDKFIPEKHFTITGQLKFGHKVQWFILPISLIDATIHPKLIIWTPLQHKLPKLDSPIIYTALDHSSWSIHIPTIKWKHLRTTKWMRRCFCVWVLYEILDECFSIVPRSNGDLFVIITWNVHIVKLCAFRTYIDYGFALVNIYLVIYTWPVEPWAKVFSAGDVRSHSKWLRKLWSARFISASQIESRNPKTLLAGIYIERERKAKFNCLHLNITRCYRFPIKQRKL